MKLSEIKKNAHKNVKTHYATYLVLCLAAVLMGSEFSSTLSLLKQDNAKSVSGLLMHSSFVKSMTFLLPEDVFGTTQRCICTCVKWNYFRIFCEDTIFRFIYHCSFKRYCGYLFCRDGFMHICVL